MRSFTLSMASSPFDTVSDSSLNYILIKVCNVARLKISSSTIKILGFSVGSGCCCDSAACAALATTLHSRTASSVVYSFKIGDGYCFGVTFLSTSKDAVYCNLLPWSSFSIWLAFSASWVSSLWARWLSWCLLWFSEPKVLMLAVFWAIELYFS